GQLGLHPMEIRLPARHPVSSACRPAGALRQASRQTRLASRTRPDRVGKLMLAILTRPICPTCPSLYRIKGILGRVAFSMCPESARKETVGHSGGLGQLGRLGGVKSVKRKLGGERKRHGPDRTARLPLSRVVSANGQGAQLRPAGTRGG